MRIDTPCRATLGEILDQGSVRSKGAAHHLRSCAHCREQLASFAMGWSRMPSSAVDRDEQFAGEVLVKIEERARHRRLLRLSAYSLASAAVAAVGYYYAGAEMLQNGLIPAWQAIVGMAQGIPTMWGTLYASFAKAFSGPVTVALAAAAAVVWVAMLDRITNLIRFHRTEHVAH